jgi:coenzyme F420-0:L-glutamate ligase/coenzyme F420-1:gamma-L-glutamate ligase
VITAVAVPGIGEVRAGDDLAALVATALAGAGVVLRDDDVVVVASKVVAKAEGRTVPAGAREGAIDEASVAEVASRRLPDGRRTRVVRTHLGPVLAAAGVDASDVPEGTVLLLPADPDASARALRSRLAELTGTRPAVLVTDTAGRPWREGVADFALGAAGLAVLDDARGRLDAHGRPLEVTVRNVADQVAALGDLVKGKARGTPVAVVSGLGDAVVAGDGPGAAVLAPGPAGDWFRHGHVEAAWHALGLPPGTGEAPPLLAASEPVADVLARAVRVALHGDTGAGCTATVEPGDGEASVLLAADHPFGLGRAVERVNAAARAEDLLVRAEVAAPDGPRTSLRVTYARPHE